LTPALQIREASTGDLSSLLALYAHLNPSDLPCPMDDAAKHLFQLGRYQGSAILVGIIDEIVVASCTLIVIPNLTRAGRPYGLIENVVTHSEWRNRGFGKAILKEATERAWAEHCYKVMLMTGSRSASTLAFYEKAGFEQSKTGFQIRSEK